MRFLQFLRKSLNVTPLLSKGVLSQTSRVIRRPSERMIPSSRSRFSYRIMALRSVAMYSARVLRENGS